MSIKKLIIFILIFLLLFFNFNSSFAIDLVVDDTTYSLPDLSTVCNYEYQCIIYTSDKFFLYDSKLPLIFNSDSHYNLDPTITSNTVKRYQFVHANNQWHSTNWELMASIVNGEYVTTGSSVNVSFGYTPRFVYSNHDIYLSSGDVIHGADTDLVLPYIANTDIDLSKGKNDYFLILPGTISDNSYITFNIYSENNGQLELLYSTVLNKNSDFYKSVIAGDALEFWYEVPVSSLDFEFSINTDYIFNLTVYAKEEYSISKKITFKGLSSTDIYNGLNTNINNKTEELKNSINQSTQQIQSTISSSTSEITNSIDKQTAVQEEQVETSKGIWGTLKSVLNFINPFSEDFFVYKLIDLLINALKSLFIPSDNFFSNYFNELLNWFSDRLGFLSYPLELILDVLNRILNINFEEPIIQIPNFVEPSTNEAIIHSQTYNLNSLLENNIFKTCHDIYFILVDAVIVFGLVNLLKHKLEEVFTK